MIMTDNPACIDISHWQGFPDFKQVAGAGVVAMIHKATEGTSYVDPNRSTNIRNAMAGGIACATYHWLKPGNAKEQMAFYLKTVNPVPGERMIIDYEEPGCTILDLHDAVQALLDDPRKLQITVYSGQLLKSQLTVKDEFLATNTDLWLAQYTTGQTSWPTETYPSWTLWQYSETGAIAGIPGTAVDCNKFNGLNKDLLNWIRPTSVAPVPEVELDVVNITITAPPNVKILVTVNDAAPASLQG
jgi:lysozyme